MAVISVGRGPDNNWVWSGSFLRQVLGAIDTSGLTASDREEIHVAGEVGGLHLDSQAFAPGQGERLGAATLDAARRLRQLVPAEDETGAAEGLDELIMMLDRWLEGSAT